MLKKYYSFQWDEQVVPQSILYCLAISWFYALCSQFTIPIPFLLTPLSIQPLPILLLSLTLGRPAVYGYVLYLAQGACGAPFFASFKSGILHLLGPTGGFLAGFLIASFFLVATHKENYSLGVLAIKIQLANVIVFSCGIARLAFFVPSTMLLTQGLYPFLLGDFFLKSLAIILGYYSFTKVTIFLKKR